MGVGRVDKSVPLTVFKARLVSYLGQVREGETVVIMDQQRQLARLVPVASNPVQDALYRLVQEGQLLWNGGKPFGLPDSEAPETQRNQVSVSVDPEPRP